MIAASTTTVRVFPNVANLAMRPPAVLARSAASLDLLNDGRVELGVPHLRRADPQLAPVLDRLKAEHHIIHGVLEDVDRALVGLVGGGDIKALRATVDQLSDTLLSHLSYEETQLIGPLSRYGFQ